MERERVWNPNADELIVSDSGNLLAGTLGDLFFLSGTGTGAGTVVDRRKRGIGGGGGEISVEYSRVC